MSSTPNSIAEELSAELLRTRHARAEEWLATMPPSVPSAKPENSESTRSSAPAVIDWLARHLTADPESARDDTALRIFAEAGRGSGRKAADRLAGVDALERMLLRDLQRIVTLRRDHDTVDLLLDAVQRLTTGIAQLRSAVVRVAIDTGEHTHQLQTFVRTLSHELKNPLGAAASGAALLQQDDIRRDDERYRKVTTQPPKEGSRGEPEKTLRSALSSGRCCFRTVET